MLYNGVLISTIPQCKSALSIHMSLPLESPAHPTLHPSPLGCYRKEQRCSQREQTSEHSRKGEGGMNWERCIERYTPPCVKYAASGKLLYNTERSTLLCKQISFLLMSLSGFGITQSWLLWAHKISVQDWYFFYICIW